MEKTTAVTTQNSINNSIFLSPMVLEDIEALICSMKTNKASGPNIIPINIFKLFKKEFLEPLSDIINCLI